MDTSAHFLLVTCHLLTEVVILRTRIMHRACCVV